MTLKDTKNVFDKRKTPAEARLFILQFMAELCWTGLDFAGVEHNAAGC